MSARRLLLLLVAAAPGACGHTSPGATDGPGAVAATGRSYVGTLEPFASEAVYFVLTDRFVDAVEAFLDRA